MLSDQPARRQQRAGAGLSVWNPRLRAKPCSLPHAVLPQILAGLPVLMAPIRGPCSRGQSVGFDMRTAPPPPAHRAAPSLFRPVGAHCSLTHRDHEPSSCPQPSALSRRSYELSHCARSPPPTPESQLLSFSNRHSRCAHTVHGSSTHSFSSCRVLCFPVCSSRSLLKGFLTASSFYLP